MKHQFIPKFAGVVKDYHPRMIADDKVSDCLNTLFKNGRVMRRFGYLSLGGNLPLNGPVVALALYEKLVNPKKYVMAFTGRDVYYYKESTGEWVGLAPVENAGVISVDSINVTGDTTDFNVAWPADVCMIKIGASDDTTSIPFTGSVGDVITQRTSDYYRSWQGAASSSDGTKLAACIHPGYIYTSTDGGATWTAQTGSGSRYWIAITSSSDGTKLAACVSNGYIYTSTDSGATWTERTGCGSRYWSGIASSSDGTKLAACAGFGYVYTSTDSGATWTEQTGSGSRGWNSIASSTDGAKLVAVNTAGANGGYIYTSTDSGATWTERTGCGQKFWTDVASSDDGVNLVAVHDNGYIYTSDDSGATWTEQTGSGSRYWRSVASSSDGAKLIACVQNGYVYTSTDSGVTWTERTAAGSRNWRPVASSSDGTKLFIGVWSGYLYTIVLYSLSLLRSVSSLTNLYVGLALSGSYIQSGTRIKSIDWANSEITMSLPATGEFSTGTVNADISTRYVVHDTTSTTALEITPIVATTGTVTSGSAVITGIPSTSGLHVGMGVLAKLVAGATVVVSTASILSIDSATQITVSENASAGSGASNLYFGVYVDSAHEVDFTISTCLTGTVDDKISWATPYEPTTADRILVISNGVDDILYWDGDESHSLAALSTLSTTAFVPPDTAKHIAYCGQASGEMLVCAWLTDTGTNQPQALVPSKAGYPADYDTGAFYDLYQNPQEITGIKSLGTKLIVYKRDSITVAYASDANATDPFDFEQDKIINCGTPSINTVVDYGNFHIFLSRDNIYMFNGIAIQPIGTAVIDAIMSQINMTYMNRAFAFPIREENLYCLCIPTGEELDSLGNVTKPASEYPDRCFVYNFAEGTWTIWEMPTNPDDGSLAPYHMLCATPALHEYAPTWQELKDLGTNFEDMNMRLTDLIQYSNIYSVYMGDNGGNIYEMRFYDVFSNDSGADIDAYFVTKDFPLNDVKHTFMFVECVLGYASQALGQTIQIEVSVDFGETWSTPIVIDQNGNTSYVEYICNFMHKGRQARLKVSNIDGSNFAIEGMILGFNEEGGVLK